MGAPRIGVVGLGYVGLPVAVALARQFPGTVGFDRDPGRVAELARGIDRTREIDPATLAASALRCAADPEILADRDLLIVAVPTPVDAAKRPDLSALVAASQTVGARLQRGALVVYESTVYPGATEEVCVPVLEASSGLRCGPDFEVGYSPERINPGDPAHGLGGVVKVISASSPAALERVAAVYGPVAPGGLHRAPSIRVAEASKVIENVQRDLNIALMNELAIIFDRMGLDTGQVLAAARTKWNFAPFHPGLVGGHCIGVDPYYLTHKAQQLGYDPQVILAGRRINDEMGRWVAQRVLRALSAQGQSIAGSEIAVLGLAFKENVPDLRNSRVIDLVRELEAWGARPRVYDPWVDPGEALAEHGIELQPVAALGGCRAVVLAVPHRGLAELAVELAGPGVGLVADLRGVIEPTSLGPSVELWRL